MFSCVVFSNKLWSSSIGKSEVTLGVTRDWLCFIALFSIKSLSAFMSYQGQMIMLVETTEVLHLHNAALGYCQLRLKQGTNSICIEECIGGGGIALCRRKLARMTGWGSSLNFLPRRQHHCIIASRLTGECV